ncbi:MAG: hypothetical protein WCO23_01070 [bacterium]
MYITILIIILAVASYSFGLKAVLDSSYKPSIYSRLIWALISINSFVGVVALHNHTGILALAGVQLLGSMAMLLASLKYSVRTFGKTEWACTFLLIVSLVVWLVFKSPIINVLISLVAHFIGGVPTIFSGWKKPKSENFLFWFFFSVASILALVNADKSDFRGFVYALYFLIFDSIITLISARQFLSRK